MTHKQICKAAFWALFLTLCAFAGALLGSGVAHVITLTLK